MALPIRKFCSLLFLIGAVLVTPSVQAQDDTQSKYDAFGKFLDTYRSENNTPAMSAVIVKDQQIVWEGYFGTYDDEGDFPTLPETTYSIASVTKPIAATAIVAESLAGLVDLDTPMTADADWADFCAHFRTTPIPFMGGGEDRHGNAIAPVDCDKPTTLEQMLDMRANGEAYVYNPIAFARIDRVILGAGGRDLRAIVRDRVADPAGMRNVALGWRDPEAGDALRHIAEPHHVVDGRIVKQAFADDDFRAAAGIKANPRAIAAFDIAYDRGVLFPPAMRKRMFEDIEIGSLGDYRAGWFLEDWQGKRLMWHSGKDDTRYSALYLKVPEDKLTLIVLANTESIWKDGASVVKVDVAANPIAARFLRNFVSE